MIRLVCALTVWLGTLFGGAAPASAQQAPATAAGQDSRQPLLFVGNSRIAPVIFVQNGAPAGVVVDLVRAVAERAQIPIEIRAMDWAEAQSLVSAGQADALLQINPSPEREAAYDFSEPLLESNFHLFRKSARVEIQGLASLRGKRVGVEAGGFPLEYLKQNQQSQTVVVPSWKAAFEMLARDELDAVFVDRWVGEYELADAGITGVTVVDPPVATSHSRIAVRKGNTELLGRINHGLSEIDRDGTRQRILANWKAKEVVYLTRESIERASLWVALGMIVLLGVIAWRAVAHSRAMKTLNAQLDDRVAQRTAELRDSEERLRLFVDHAPAALAMFDRDMRYLAASRRWLADYGLVGRDVIGQSHIEVFPEIPERWREFDRRGLAGEVVRMEEDSFQRADGTTQWLRWEIRPWHTADGHVAGIVIFTEDITEHKRAEQTLRESEERFRTLSRLAPAGIYLTDAAGQCVYVNDRWCEMAGLTPEQARGDGWLQGIHPDDRPAVQANWHQMVQSSGRWGLEYRFRDRREQVIWVYGTATVLHDSAGQVVGFVGLNMDITDRKQADERAQQEHQQIAFANRVLSAFVEREGDDIFDQALAVVLEEMSSRHGVFGYICEPGHLICPSLSKMLDACEIEGKCIHYPPEKWKGLWARALKQKRSLYTNEAPPVPPGHPVIHNNLATPIMLNGEAIGLLNVANKEGGYTEADRDRLDALANRVAPVLYAWMQRKLREDDRQQANEDLRRKQAELRLLFDNTPAGLVLFDGKPPYRVLSHNRRYQEWFAEPFRSQGMVGRSVFDYAPELEATGCIAAIEEVLSTRKPKVLLDFPYAPDPAKVRWFNWYMVPLILDGEVVALVSMSLDVTETHQAEETLKRMRNMLAEAQQIAHLGSFEYVAATQTTIWSEEEYRIYGLDPAGPSPAYDVMLAQCIHPDDAALLHETFTTAMANRAVYVLEHRIVRPDGSVRWVYDRAEPHLDEQGNLVRYIGATLDITDRKQAEEALRQLNATLERRVAERTGEVAAALKGVQAERKRFLDMLETLPVILAVIRSDHRLEWVNRAYRESLGDNSGKLCYHSQFGRDTPCDECQAFVPLKTGKPHYWQWTLPNGRTFDIHNFPFTATDGLPCILEMDLDITDRVQAEAKVRAERQRLYDVLETLPVYVVLLGEDYRVPFANKFFEERFGQSQGRRCYEYLFSRAEPCDNCESFKPFKTGQPHHWFWTGPDGRNYDIYDFPFTDADGTRMVMEMGIDITEQRQAEQALRAAHADLAKTVDSLQTEAEQRQNAQQALREVNDQLAQRASQLRALAGQLTLAEQRERRRMARLLHDHLQQLLVGAKFRLSVLGRHEDVVVKQATEEVSQLLDESIQASRSLTAELSPPILHEAGLNAGLEWLTHWMADKHGLFVDLIMEEDATALAEDVTVLLFESVRELLFNCVKHSKTRSATVNLRRVDGQIQIVVADQGAGFDPAALRPAGTDGGGFGLFSIRERLDLFGGRLELDSAPGKGSRFVLSAPVGPTPAADPTPDATPEPLTDGQPTPVAAPLLGAKIRVLLADDHVVMREGLARLLGQEPDIEIVGQAADGQEAIALATTLLPDVILMDGSMPKLNGVEATRAIHNDYPEIHIIGLSMFDESERAQSMCDAGATDYLAKSGPPDLLVAAIRGCMNEQTRHVGPANKPHGSSKARRKGRSKK